MVRQMAVALCLVLMIFAAGSFGQGFRNPPPGMEALSQGGAFTAQADDASAVFINPAGLVQIQENQFLISTNFLMSSTKFSNGILAGEKQNESAFLGDIYLVIAPTGAKYRFGLAVTTPYGQKTEWDPALTKNAWLCQVPYLSEMSFYDVSPALAVAVNEQFSVGFALDFYRSAVKTVQIYPWSFLGPFTDGTATLKGDGTALGGKIGLHYHNGPHRIAAVWNAPFSIDYSGSFFLTEIPIPGFFPQTDSRVKIQYPEIFSFGYAWSKNRLRLQTEAEYVRYSCLKSIPVDIGPDNALPGFLTDIPKNWKDVWNLSFGIAYRVKPNWEISGGVGFIRTPVPDATFDPSLPDADRTIFSLGSTFFVRKATIELVYVYNLFQSREIKTGGFLGTYKSSGSFIGLQYAQSF
jgi:long-chain fatty acid transport protein